MYLAGTFDCLPVEQSAWRFCQSLLSFGAGDIAGRDKGVEVWQDLWGEMDRGRVGTAASYTDCDNGSCLCQSGGAGDICVSIYQYDGSADDESNQRMGGS